MNTQAPHPRAADSTHSHNPKSTSLSNPTYQNILRNDAEAASKATRISNVPKRVVLELDDEGDDRKQALTSPRGKASKGSYSGVSNI